MAKDKEPDWVQAIIDSIPTYEDYLSGDIKGIVFLGHSETGQSMYLWTRLDQDTEIDRAFLEKHYPGGEPFDTIAVFKLHKLIRWGQRREDKEHE